MAYKSYRPRKFPSPSKTLRRKAVMSRSRRTGAIKQIASIPRLVNRGIHYFKRVGAQVPLTFQYAAAAPSTPGLVVSSPAILTSGGANILGYTMASTASSGVNMCNGVSIYCGSGQIPNTSNFGFSISFSLQQVMEHIDFTTLFDRYKILGVKVDLQWHSNVAQMNNAAVFPTLYYVYDSDDATVPIDKKTMLKQEGVKQRVMSKAGKYSFYCKPRQLITTATTTSGATNQITGPAKWINSADAGVNHYAMKFFVDDVPFATGCYNLLQIQPTFYLALKDTI